MTPMPREPARVAVTGPITDDEARILAAHALLVAGPDGYFADYAECLLRAALPRVPALRGVLATLAVCMARGDVREAARQVVPFLPGMHEASF